jgi:hypothetical protein
LEGEARSCIDALDEAIARLDARIESQTARRLNN